VRQVIVRYKLKPECIDEHLALIGAVFQELAHARPLGLRYAVTRAADGVSFTHISVMEGAGNPLAALESFRAFTRDVDRRCDEAPRPVDVTVVGDYGIFS
jgi:hypothetical protein